MSTAVLLDNFYEGMVGLIYNRGHMTSLVAMTILFHRGFFERNVLKKTVKHLYVGEFPETRICSSAYRICLFAKFIVLICCPGFTMCRHMHHIH